MSEIGLHELKLVEFDIKFTNEYYFVVNLPELISITATIVQK